MRTDHARKNTGSRLSVPGYALLFLIFRAELLANVVGASSCCACAGRGTRDAGRQRCDHWTGLALLRRHVKLGKQVAAVAMLEHHAAEDLAACGGSGNVMARGGPRPLGRGRLVERGILVESDRGRVSVAVRVWPRVRRAVRRKCARALRSANDSLNMTTPSCCPSRPRLIMRWMLTSWCSRYWSSCFGRGGGGAE